jgi:hypothetical protein
MMQPGWRHPYYTGTALLPPRRGIMLPGHCGKCGQPSAQCCCGCRECRKEAKELTVAPGISQREKLDQADMTAIVRMLHLGAPQDAQLPEVSAANTGLGTAFIGGGCCTTLSIEYAASVATSPFAVVVLVRDSEGTLLAWGRAEPAGTPYRVHECIITTKPGATVIVVALNCTARLRWCEVFSCC